jgi:hypothetical protein
MCTKVPVLHLLGCEVGFRSLSVVIPTLFCVVADCGSQWHWRSRGCSLGCLSMVIPKLFCMLPVVDLSSPGDLELYRGVSSLASKGESLPSVIRTLCIAFDGIDRCMAIYT